MKNLIAWVEIPTVNFERAVNFYSLVFNLELDAHDFGKEKMAFFPNGEGAISFAPGFKPGKDGILVSLNAKNDIDEIIEKINANGGSILQSKTKIEAENRGFFAIFVDCEGNKVGLYGDK
jgi:predicted enzyme related to lactoylglutathione lyase